MFSRVFLLSLLCWRLERNLEGENYDEWQGPSKKMKSKELLQRNHSERKVSAVFPLYIALLSGRKKAEGFMTLISGSKGRV